MLALNQLRLTGLERGQNHRARSEERLPYRGCGPWERNAAPTNRRQEGWLAARRINTLCAASLDLSPVSPSACLHPAGSHSHRHPYTSTDGQSRMQRGSEGSMEAVTHLPPPGSLFLPLKTQLKHLLDTW